MKKTYTKPMIAFEAYALDMPIAAGCAPDSVGIAKELEEMGYFGNSCYDLISDDPRKSKCNCPHADGKRIICKHIVSAYFTVLPGEAERFNAEAMAYQEEEERRNEELIDKVCHYVRRMKKNELQEALLQLLFDGPEWQFERFARDNGLENDWW